MIFNERDTWYPSHFWIPVGKLILGCTAITDLKGTVSRSLRVCVVWTHVWLTGHIHIYWTHAHMLLRKALTEEQRYHLGETDRPFKKLRLHWPRWAHCFVFPRRLVLWQPHQRLASSALFMADLTGRYYRCGSFVCPRALLSGSEAVSFIHVLLPGFQTSSSQRDWVLRSEQTLADFL